MSARLRGALHGHYWTLRGALGARLRPRPVFGARRWRGSVNDPRRGEVALTGAMHRAGGAQACLVVVHGLGGSAESSYCHDAARAGLAAGLDVLRLNMRGAGGCGRDVYHAGLSDDVLATLASLPHQSLLLLGVSMGGHLSLWVALQSRDPRLKAVAAICPPLDLAQGCRDIDHPRRRLYRDEVLQSLVRAAHPVAEAGGIPIDSRALRGLRSLRQWDQEVVVPRYGLGDVDTYHRTMSIGDKLGGLERPALLVGARHDPMVLGTTVSKMLDRHPASSALELRWLDRAGHVGFPRDVHLGVETAGLGVYPQVVGWLVERS